MVVCYFLHNPSTHICRHVVGYSSANFCGAKLGKLGEKKGERNKGLGTELGTSSCELVFSSGQLMQSNYVTTRRDSPVQAWFILQDVRVDQLFKQTVHQDGQRGEADVVQCQINTVVQRLRGPARKLPLTKIFKCKT